MNSQPYARKVAIPRLAMPDQDQKPPRSRHAKHRVQKACNNCHKRKGKCNGERPHCRYCVDHHMPCTYSQARSDRLKKYVSQTLKIAPLIPLELSIKTVGSFLF
ncbi:hypothetical protein PMIN01_13467 [Paraphaeosphaeria minitans]|uniref:Zn(2)-C6 fungal-type domain-containing protein n=1 Tax=Paraphaeosphaeria minitans TaxID=565426 RepID=A0A9P6G484_9PLEO|nr:hypothetical protein PMIN01_13467 [Paraphaeosphaeria minitans]